MTTHIKHMLGALLALAAAGAQAQASTGSLVGWSASGDASAQGGAITLTTAYLDGGTDQPLNLSGISAADIGVVEAAAGVAPRGLDLLEPDFGTEGSVIGQTFAVNAGDTLSFNWTFGGVEDFFLDRAFVVLNGQLTTLATRLAPGAASNSFSHSFAQSGIATLALGVIDTGDYLGVSTLTVSNLVLSAVPEPTPLALWAAGLAALGLASQRRRSSAR